jgi:hypothetical protein
VTARANRGSGLLGSVASDDERPTEFKVGNGEVEKSRCNDLPGKIFGRSDMGAARVLNAVEFNFEQTSSGPPYKRPVFCRFSGQMPELALPGSEHLFRLGRLSATVRKMTQDNIDYFTSREELPRASIRQLNGVQCYGVRSVLPKVSPWILPTWPTISDSTEDDARQYRLLVNRLHHRIHGK